MRATATAYTRRIGLARAALALGLACAPEAATDATRAAEATLRDRAGRVVGSARLSETPHGVLVRAEFTNLPPGTHAFHIHETGECDPPFRTAGGHFNPEGRRHGFRNPLGHHLGDLPNLEVPGPGSGTVEHFVPSVSLDAGSRLTLLDADGSALIVHIGADDHASDPSGAAGERIACGVVIEHPGAPSG